jgi:hypothetical protein
MIRPKADPSRLDPLSYGSLRQQILRREFAATNHFGRVEGRRRVFEYCRSSS